MSDITSQRPFAGWQQVAVAFVTLFISVGFGFYSYGAFFPALADEFGGSRFGVGIGMSVFFLTNGLLSPFLGSAIETGSIRRVQLQGIAFLVVGLVVASLVQQLWQFYLVLGGLLAVGACLLGGLTGSTLVSNWFVRRRGMALGVATMGISFSGMVMAPLATWLIQHYGWRNTFLAYAGLAVVLVLPAVFFLVIDRPEDIGQRPDGDPEPPAGFVDLEAHEERYSSSFFLRSRNFWVIAVVMALNFHANGALLTHAIPHARDLGFSAQRSALLLSAIAGVGVLGKIIFGWVSDHVDQRMALWLATACQAVAVVGFLLFEDYPRLLVAASVFGLGMGGMVPLWGALIGASFGRRAFGRVMGLMTPVMLPIQVTGVPLAGFVYDRQGSYNSAFVLFIGLYLLSMLVLLWLRSDSRSTLPKPVEQLA